MPMPMYINHRRNRLIVLSLGVPADALLDTRLGNMLTSCQGRNEMKEKKESKPTGRPPKPMPERIDDTPENVMRVLVSTPPKKSTDWDYLKKARKAAG